MSIVHAVCYTAAELALSFVVLLVGFHSCLRIMIRKMSHLSVFGTRHGELTLLTNTTRPKSQTLTIAYSVCLLHSCTTRQALIWFSEVES